MISSIAIAYGITSFSAATLHNLFLIYYIDLFFNVYKLDHSWFYFVQVIYMIWNSLNDPLFGWFLSNSGFSRRINAIRYGGVLWAIGEQFKFFPFKFYRINQRTYSMEI